MTCFVIEYLGATADTENPVDAKWLLSYDELRQEIQASDEEFTSSLFTLCVVELRGKMRMLSTSAVREVTRDLLDTTMEQGWFIWVDQYNLSFALYVVCCMSTTFLSSLLIQLINSVHTFLTLPSYSFLYTIMSSLSFFLSSFIRMVH